MQHGVVNVTSCDAVQLCKATSMPEYCCLLTVETAMSSGSDTRVLPMQICCTKLHQCPAIAVCLLLRLPQAQVVTRECCPCRYSAPELLLGNREPCTFAADMYSLGVVLVSASRMWHTIRLCG